MDGVEGVVIAVVDAFLLNYPLTFASEALLETAAD